MVQVKKEDQEVKGRGGERLGKKRVFVICSSTGKKRIYMSVARKQKENLSYTKKTCKIIYMCNIKKTKALVTDLNLFFVGVVGWRWLLGSWLDVGRHWLVGWSQSGILSFGLRGTSLGEHETRF